MWRINCKEHRGIVRGHFTKNFDINFVDSSTFWDTYFKEHVTMNFLVTREAIWNTSHVTQKAAFPCTSYLSLSTNQNAYFLFIRETHENIIYYTRTLHYFAFFYILHIDQVSVWLLKLQIFKIDKFHLHFLSSIFHS